MRPEENRGGVIFESGKDRRYARAAARRLGSKALDQAVNVEENRIWKTLYDYKAERVSSSEIEDTRFHGYILHNRFTAFKSDEDLVDELASEFANDYIAGAETELGAHYKPKLAEGLTAIAEGGKLRAALSFTRPCVAAQMLEDISLSTN